MRPPTVAGSTTALAIGRSLFQQRWWLDAVAPGCWDEVTFESGGAVVGRLLFCRQRRFGLTLLSQPPLTPFLGPRLELFGGKGATLLSQQEKIFTGLIKALPPHDIFRQSFHYSIDNWLPFYWQGFQQTTRYSYIIDDLSDLDAIWHHLNSNIRREIRKAQRQLTVRKDDDLDRFLHLNRATFVRQGLALPYADELVRRLDAACVARGARQMLFADDATGRTHASHYMVWDEDSAYYLMSGVDPALRTTGAASLLIWEAIRHAHSLTRRFDFEGSMLPTIERFVRAFGGRQTPYFQLVRGTTMLGRLALGGVAVLGIDRSRALLGHG